MGSVARREELCFAEDPQEASLFLVVIEIERRFGGKEEDIIAGSNLRQAQTDDFAVVAAHEVPFYRALTDFGADHHAKTRYSEVILRHFHAARTIKGAQLAFEHAGDVGVVTEAVLGGKHIEVMMTQASNNC